MGSLFRFTTGAVDKDGTGDADPVWSTETWRGIGKMLVTLAKCPSCVCDTFGRSFIDAADVGEDGARDAGAITRSAETWGRTDMRWGAGVGPCAICERSFTNADVGEDGTTDADAIRRSIEECDADKGVEGEAGDTDTIGRSVELCGTSHTEERVLVVLISNLVAKSSEIFS